MLFPIAQVTGSAVSSFVGGKQLALVLLPDSASRYYSPTHSLAISGGLTSAAIMSSKSAAVLILLKSSDHLLPSAMVCHSQRQYAASSASGPHKTVDASNRR